MSRRTCYNVRMPTLVVVQSEMHLGAYRSEDAFRAWLRASVALARPALASGEPALVAFPELIGMPLLLTGAPAPVRACRTWMQAAVVLLAWHQRSVRANVRRCGRGWKQALLLALSRRHVRRIYHDAFSELARDLGATVVAGSAPIEGPEGEVANIAYVFGPDGRLLGQQRKVNLTPPEGPSGLDVVAGTLEETHPFDTPAGRVGVAVCLDAFDTNTCWGEPRPQPSVAGRLAEQGAEILVQPSLNPNPWTAEEAAGWQEGLYRRMQEHAGFAAGLNPMMVGRVLDLKAEGVSVLLGPGVRATPPDPYLARAGSHNKGEVLVARV